MGQLHEAQDSIRHTEHALEQERAAREKAKHEHAEVVTKLEHQWSRHEAEVADAQEEEKWRLQEAHRAARDEMSRQLEESYEHKLVDRDKELSALKGKLFSAEEFIGQNVLNLERVTNRLYSGKKRNIIIAERKETRLNLSSLAAFRGKCRIVAQKTLSAKRGKFGRK